jgi:hypothetical protein
MVAIEEAGFLAPGLRIDAIALRGGAARAPSEDLHDYAAAFTAGRRAAAADLAALELAIEDLGKTSVCAAR